MPDPYGSHDDRWFSDGEPTSLVRDQGIESCDEPPRGQLPLGPLGRDEPGQEGPPRYPQGPAGGQERLARAGGEWHWWTVCLLGLLALAVSGFLFVGATIASAMNCFDRCDTSVGPTMSAVADWEFIVFIAAGVLLVGGMVVPAWRRVVAAALSAAIALAIGFALLTWI